MFFNTADMIPFEDDAYDNEPARPELAIPSNLRAKWEIQDAIASLFETPDVSEPVIEQGIQPLWGYPYEDRMGHTDFSVLDPPDPQKVVDEIRQAIADVIEESHLPILPSYEDDAGNADLSVLDPPDHQEALDEIPQAIDEEIEQARLRNLPDRDILEPYPFGLP